MDFVLNCMIVQECFQVFPSYVLHCNMVFTIWYISTIHGNNGGGKSTSSSYCGCHNSTIARLDLAQQVVNEGVLNFNRFLYSQICLCFVPLWDIRSTKQQQLQQHKSSYNYNYTQTSATPSTFFQYPCQLHGLQWMSNKKPYLQCSMRTVQITYYNLIDRKIGVTLMPVVASCKPSLRV